MIINIYILKNFQKVLVWVAVSENGISQPFFLESGHMNSATYSSECIQKRLVKFIRNHHSGEEIIFWPDLATIHYSRQTLNLLHKLNIKVVPKDINPPSVPQLRPIEQLWSIIKQRTYAGGWKTDSKKVLMRKITSVISNFKISEIRNLMKNLKSNLRSS